MIHVNGKSRALVIGKLDPFSLNLLARDIHELGRPGMLEQMISGTIDGVMTTEILMLLGGIMAMNLNPDLDSVVFMSFQLIA